MRRKADGTAFEREFKDAASQKVYVKRLPTLTSQNAGAGQPADFYVVGNIFNYVETKETAADSFSIREMQQLDKVQDFVEDEEFYRKKTNAKMEYWIIVHFICRKTFIAITAKGALKLLEKRQQLKCLKPPEDAVVADTLEGLIDRIHF